MPAMNTQMLSSVAWTNSASDISCAIAGADGSSPNITAPIAVIKNLRFILLPPVTDALCVVVA